MMTSGDLSFFRVLWLWYRAYF